MSEKTVSWILRHPPKMLPVPNGYRQVVVIGSSPNFDQAVHTAQKMNKFQFENFSRDRIAHYGNRDVYTIIEMHEGSTKQDAIESFFDNKQCRREIVM
jgi:hypothetical protein